MDYLNDCKLTIDGQVDASSVAAIVRDVTGPLGPEATDEQKVLALYRWVLASMFVYPCSAGDLHEGGNKACEILNFWGYGLCGTHAKVFGALCQHLLGHEHVRLLGMGEREPGSWLTEQRGAKAFLWSERARDVLPYRGQGHSMLEVRFDGRWHFLDVMVGFYRRDQAGRIVEIDELLGNPKLAERGVGDPDGDMPYGPEPEIFTETTVKFKEINYNFWPGRLGPLNLRPGERFTWLAEPVPGEYWLHPRLRQRFGSDRLAPGPRGHRPDRPGLTWGNGQHVLGLTLRPTPDDPFWCAETADWHVPVELPWPITSIHWQMDSGCSGFLDHPPSGGDHLIPITAAGNQHTPEAAPAGHAYRVICRSADRSGPMRLTLRTIVQLNPLVTPRLGNGENVVRLSAANGQPDDLSARLTCRVDDAEQKVDLTGLGEHVVRLPQRGRVTAQSITLVNTSAR